MSEQPENVSGISTQPGTSVTQQSDDDETKEEELRTAAGEYCEDFDASWSGEFYGRVHECSRRWAGG